MVKAHDAWTVLPHGPLEPLADNLWRVEGSLPQMGLPRAMTLVRLGDGRLLIHSAIALDDATRRQLEALGEPGILVVPNGWHRLDARAYKDRYPRLYVTCPRGARRKVEQVVAVDGPYDQAPTDGTVTFEHLRGVKESEGVLRVRSSDGLSLVFNDVIFNLPHLSGVEGLIMRLIGSTGGPKVTRVSRTLMIKHRRATREHLLTLADLPDLRRIVVSHGQVILADAPATLRQIASRL